MHARLRNLILHAKTNPWWTHRLPVLDHTRSLASTLENIPILGRQDLQLYFQDMQVKIPGSVDSDFVIASTSGSTGKPVRVRKYLPSFGLQNQATQLLPFKWHQLDQRLPMLQLRWNGDSFNAAHTGPPFNYLGETGAYRAMRISETDFGKIAETIEQERIGILLCSPTALKELIKTTVEEKKNISGLNAILTFSERLSPDVRKDSAILSGAKVIDRYSSEELGLMAVDCPFENHLHQISVHNYIEIVDEDNQPCPKGKSGRVLVTGLSSYGMPLIRYELGDYASFGEECSGGITFPVIVPEVYRLKETLTDQDGKRFTVSAAGADALKTAPIFDFQVFLFNNAIVVAYSAKAELSEDVVTAITTELKSRFRSSSPVAFKKVISDFKIKNWKRRDFIKVDANFHEHITEDRLLGFE